jgi:phosphohistidine swiveling domain-containing protein
MTFCVRLGRDAPPDRIGGKARSLLRLTSAGLPVPPAVVVTTDLFAALRADGPSLPDDLTTGDALARMDDVARALATAPWPAAFVNTLVREVDTLMPDPGARFAVRSSAKIEDKAGALAAGLFSSRVDVARGDVLAAMREVLGSALSPAVIAYLRQNGLGTDALGFAVLIHPFVSGEAAGAAAFDAASSEAPLIEVHTGDAALLELGTQQQLSDTMRKLAATFGPVEVEWVSSGGEITYLQMRPYRSPARAIGGSRVLEEEAAQSQGSASLESDWRWDAAHNPMPLSPAQAGLVALVDARCRTGLHQRVVGGYLFYATDPTSKTAPIGAAEALRVLYESAAQELSRPTPTLEEALETFLAIYQPLFGVVQPNARAARGGLAAFLRRRGFDPGPLMPRLLTGVASAASVRRKRARELAVAGDGEATASALAAYLDRFGDEAPRWDVAEPTWREAPAALERLVIGAPPDAEVDPRAWKEAAEAVRVRLPDEFRLEWDTKLSIARAAVGVAEDDDALYARIQTHVRRALLREGERLRAGGVIAAAEDVFWLPFDAVRRDARGEAALSQDEARRAVEAARAADTEARANPPPLGAAESTDVGSGTVRGMPGGGGAKIGRVRIYCGQDAKSIRGLVLVARTLLPTELPLLTPAAIVVETGGILDHVAAQARERALPTVVGAVGALRLLRDGDQVLVDGNAGLVVKLR